MDTDQEAASEHLKDLLQNCSVCQLDTQDDNFILEHGVENFIHQSVVSAKFKKWNVSEAVDLKIKEAIHASVSMAEPIRFVLPFGGYKLWHLPVYCEVSWCEFFAMAFYSQYVAPVLASYGPGVVFSFITDDVIINSMGEVPKADVERYFRSFGDLISAFENFFPSNLRFELRVDDSDAYANAIKRWGENKILVSCTPIPGSVSLGSTPKSIATFWAGMGVLEVRPEGLVDRIVSVGIWEEIAGLPHGEVAINLIGLHNLNKIFVYPDKFGVGRYHRP